jgi:hypothetical protein
MSEMVQWDMENLDIYLRTDFLWTSRLVLSTSHGTYTYDFPRTLIDVRGFSDRLVDLDLFVVLYELFEDAIAAFMGSIQ